MGGDQTALRLYDHISAATRPYSIALFYPGRDSDGGVDAKVMLSARPSGNPLPDWARNTYMAEVVSSGARVFRYEKGYLHAKTISIDSKICSIGSANIDIRSFSITDELNAVLYSTRSSTELEEAFRHDSAYCTEFDSSAYHRRYAAVRFRDSLARLCSPLL